MGLFKKNPFGHILFLKKFLIRFVGALSHRRFRGFNELQIEGSEIIKNLPDRNVLFVSNHQTYFADVTAMFHVFNTDIATFSFEYLSYPNLAVALISLFYSLRTWTSGKGWFSILFHSIYNAVAFIVLGITGENPWVLSVDDGVTEIGMLILSLPLLAITYGLYRWREKRDEKKNFNPG